MATQDSIPIFQDNETFYVPYFEIRVGLQPDGTQQGTLAPLSVIRDIIDVTYEDSIEKVDAFTLTVNNWDADTRQPKYIGMETPPKPGSDDAKRAAIFEPGNEIALYMGYQGNLRLMMTGFITTVEPDFPEAGAPRLVVRGLNVLDRFRQKQYTWAWPDDDRMTIRDSDIAAALSRKPDDSNNRPGLDIEVRTDSGAADKEPQEPYVLMDNQYPIVFLMERARRRGYSLFVAEEVVNNQSKRFLYFGPTQALRDVTYQLEWGKSLSHFRPMLTTVNQAVEVTVHGWDRLKKQPIAETAKLDDCKDLNPDLHAVVRAAGRKEVITDQPVHTSEQAKKLALDTLRKQLKEIVRADGATVGLPDLRSGRVVDIKGCGYRFNGRYFVTDSTHVINDSGYRTTFKARREDKEGKPT